MINVFCDPRRYPFGAAAPLAGGGMSQKYIYHLKVICI